MPVEIWIGLSVFPKPAIGRKPLDKACQTLQTVLQGALKGRKPLMKAELYIHSKTIMD